MGRALLEPLALTVIIAENMDGIALTEPAVELLEKFAALRLGNLRFGSAFSQWTKRVEIFKSQIVQTGTPHSKKS